MTRRIYIAPIVSETIGSRIRNYSKVYVYTGFGGASKPSVMPNPVKTWCITTCDVDDTLHADIVADTDIFYIPAHRLDDTWADFTPAQRTAIANKLEAVRIPMDWITTSTTVRDLLRMSVRTFHLVSMLKTDYPEVGLDTTFGDLNAAWRNRILTWADNNGVSTAGLTNTTTIRVLLRALVVRYPWDERHDFVFMRPVVVSQLARLLQRAAAFMRGG